MCVLFLVITLDTGYEPRVEGCEAADVGWRGVADEARRLELPALAALLRSLISRASCC